MPMSSSHDAVVEPETRVDAVLSLMRSHAQYDARLSVLTTRLQIATVNTWYMTAFHPSLNEVADRRLVAPDTASPCFFVLSSCVHQTKQLQHVPSRLFQSTSFEHSHIPRFCNNRIVDSSSSSFIDLYIRKLTAVQAGFYRRFMLLKLSSP